MESLIIYEHTIIITGDLNINILKSDNPKKDYLRTLAANGYHLTNIAPTRVLAATTSCGDDIIVNKTNEVIVKTLDDCFIVLYHFPYS